MRFLLVLILILAGCEDPTACSDPGDICTVVGTGHAGWNGDGPAAEIDLYRPIAVLPDGDRVWFLDWNNHRLRVLQDDAVSTAVGNEIPGDGPQDGSEYGDGAPGLDVPMNHPTDLALLDGDVLLTVWHNHKLRRYDPVSGLVTVVAGGEPGFTGDGGPAQDALLQYPQGGDVEDGVIWFTDNENGRVRRIVDGTIETVAGTDEVGWNGDDLPPLETRLGLPPGSGEGFEPGGGLLIDDGIIWLAESLTHRIRRFDPAAGTFATVAGTGEAGWDGDGEATSVRLTFPHDLERGPDGALWFSDAHNHAVRRLVDGEVQTMVGGHGAGFGGDGGPASEAVLSRPAGIAFDDAGDLWIADHENHRIRRVLRGDW